MDGEHKAWFILDIDGKEQAQNILPLAFRRKAKIIKLNKFSLDNLEEITPYHDQ